MVVADFLAKTALIADKGSDLVRDPFEWLTANPVTIGAASQGNRGLILGRATCPFKPLDILGVRSATRCARAKHVADRDRTHSTSTTTRISKPSRNAASMHRRARAARTRVSPAPPTTCRPPSSSCFREHSHAPRLRAASCGRPHAEEARSPALVPDETPRTTARTPRARLSKSMASSTREMRPSTCAAGTATCLSGRFAMIRASRSPSRSTTSGRKTRSTIRKTREDFDSDPFQLDDGQPGMDQSGQDRTHRWRGRLHVRGIPLPVELSYSIEVVSTTPGKEFENRVPTPTSTSRRTDGPSQEAFFARTVTLYSFSPFRLISATNVRPWYVPIVPDCDTADTSQPAGSSTVLRRPCSVRSKTRSPLTMR